MTDASRDSGENSTSSTRAKTLNFEALRTHVVEHKIDCALWAIRMLVVFLSVGYIIPLFWSSQNAYYKALTANAAISALRLHQRLGRVQFTRQFAAELTTEDSFHYLFYSLIFLYSPPITLVLLPVVLFAILHAASYSLTLLDTLGQNSWWGARLLISIVEFQSLTILRLAAFTEIMLMPFTVWLVLIGRVGLLTPFIYYQFLTRRYASRRNPYTRNMFAELRMLLETTAAKPSMPGFVRSALLGVVKFTSQLAPPLLHTTQQQPQQQQQQQ